MLPTCREATELLDVLDDARVPRFTRWDARFHIRFCHKCHVAALHLLAMDHPAAKGERFIAAAPGTYSMADVARVLKRRLGPAGAHVSTRELPNWLVRLAALWNPAAKMVVPHLGTVRETSSAKAEQLPGWRARPFEEAVVAAAERLLRLGVVKTV